MYIYYGNRGLFGSIIYPSNSNPILFFFLVLNQFLSKIDARLDRQRKPGGSTNIKRERVEGTPSSSHPPFNLPKWMISPAYQSIMSTVEGIVGAGAGSTHTQGSVSVQSEGMMSDNGLFVCLFVCCLPLVLHYFVVNSPIIIDFL